jgi:hypothetical protein
MFKNWSNLDNSISVRISLQEETDLEGLQPFQYMLQFLLSALLAPANGEPPAASLPIILKVLRYLKRTEDTLASI